MSDERKEATAETPKPETPEMIDITAPRPADLKSINSSEE